LVFASLLLDVGAENGRPMLQADPRLVTKAEAIILMNFRFKTVDRLIELGKLRPKGKTTNLIVFDRKKVLELSRKYVKSSDVYHALGITTYAFRDLMAAKGIRPLPKSADTMHSDTLYVRQEVLGALRLDSDPSLPDDPRLMEFWKRLKSAIKSRIPTIHLPERLSSLTTRASTSSRACRFAVTHDLDAGSVSIAFEPATAGRCLSVDLDDRERWPAAIAEIVDIAVNREREFKAASKVRSAVRYRASKDGIAERTPQSRPFSRMNHEAITADLCK
jgi:hypothetical protein